MHTSQGFGIVNYESARKRRSRLGIGVRLAGIALIAGIVAVDGSLIATRVTEGKTYSYSAVVKADVDAYVAARQAADVDGVQVGRVFVNENASGFAVTATSKDIKDVLATPGVSHVEMNGKVDNHQSWWKDLKNTMNL